MRNRPSSNLAPKDEILGTYKTRPHSTETQYNISDSTISLFGHQESEDASQRNSAKDRDMQLIKLTLNGDNDAFKSLYNFYYSRLYSAALSLVRNENDASDLVQETFLKAYKGLSRFEGNAQFYTWLYRILYNCTIDASRKAYRKAEMQVEEPGKLLCDSDDLKMLSHISKNPEHHTLMSELRGIIAEGLHELSPKHRAVITLREVEDLSYEQIGKQLGCSIGTVMSRLHHARRKLADSLRKKLPPDITSLFEDQSEVINIL